MSATNELIDGMAQGREWIAMGDSESVRTLLGRVYDERYHSAAHHKDRFQLRVNLQKKDDAASYAGWITAENPMSGPYQGTSFVWFPGMRGSVAVLVIGTDGFGADTTSSTSALRSRMSWPSSGRTSRLRSSPTRV